jgi:hypothetical protein
VDFQPETCKKPLLGDKILIKAYGVGLKLTDFPDTKVMNMDPIFLEKINPKPKGEKLEVPMAHMVPVTIMDSGYKSGAIRRLRHTNV